MLSKFFTALPLEYEVHGRIAVVLGADASMSGRIVRLQALGAVVRVWDYDLPIDAAVASRLAVEKGRPDEAALTEACLVYASPELPGAELERLHAWARGGGRLFCTPDRPALSTFANPSVVESHGVGVRFSTGGRSPGIARALREGLERILGDERLARFVARLTELRAASTAGDRSAAMREAVRGFELQGRLVFPEWFERGDVGPPARRR